MRVWRRQGGNGGSGSALPVVCGFRRSAGPALPASRPQSLAMAPSGAVLALLSLLAGGGPSQLDCVCSRLASLDTLRNSTEAERLLYDDYCVQEGSFTLVERCRVLQPPSTAADAVSLLVPRGWGAGRQPSLSGGPDSNPRPAGPDGGDCGAALAAVRQLDSCRDLLCFIADACAESCPAPGLNDTEWTVETLVEDGLRHQRLSQLLLAVRRITRAIRGRLRCAQTHTWRFPWGFLLKMDRRVDLSPYLRGYSERWQAAPRLMSLAVDHLSRLFIPLAFEHKVNPLSDQKLTEWIKSMERVRDMLDTRLRGLIHDVRLLSREVVNYKMEADGRKPGNYIVRRPLLSIHLLGYQKGLLGFDTDFSPICKEQQPKASEMFALADTLYSLYKQYLDFFGPIPFEYRFVTDEEWQLEDQSSAALSVDTGCLQLLVDAVDRPRCPLEQLPPEAARRRRQCREQLWRDLALRPPHAPVTSYLAYTQRASVSLCLLAWMAANSLSICQDVPFTMIQSVHDARCYFDTPDNHTCLQSNATDAICHVSRALLLLKCRDFSSFTPVDTCSLHISTTEAINNVWKAPDKVYQKATQTTLNYKDSLNNATLKYKDFKIDRLKPLEYTFIGVNSFFRFSTAGLYMYLPHLRNLPGKILLCFQTTGIVQLLCSEFLYRMAGVPDLSTAVLIDSSLTLLGCLWLNALCYQMYSCVRHLRLPNELLPVEARSIFRRQVKFALIPWSILCTACTAMEKSNRYYLMYSRIIFVTAISMSVAVNLVLLGLVGYIYLCNKNSMKRLEISVNEEYFSKKKILFLTVNTIILSGICVIIRIGFHQAQGIAQLVYYVHIASMVQGPVQFVFFVCNGTTVSVLRNGVVAWWSPDIISRRQQLCSTAERNLPKWRHETAQTAESSL